MRVCATLLTMLLAMLVIEGVGPELSVMTAQAPCEIAPLVSGPIGQRKVPKGVAGIPGFDDLLEAPFVSGPHAAAEWTDEQRSGASDPHAYFVALASRSDCFAAYSLRNDAQVVTYTYPKNGPRDMAYVYPADTDRRRQDAMRILTRADQAGPGESLRLPLGAHHPNNLLVVEERWWGAEMNYDNTKIGYYKGDPYFHSGINTTWVGVRTQLQEAIQNTHTLPPGGPYVLMLNPHSGNASNIKAPFYRDGDRTHPRLRLPYNRASKETRGYSEGVAPRDTSAGPEGAEFGVVAERWTRIWHFFERAPEEDWRSDVAPAGARTAYRWSMWAADTEREPIRLINGAIIAIYPGSTGLTDWRMHMGVGNAYSDIPATRGKLLAYVRNVVVLHGTSTHAVRALLQKP